MPYPRPLKRRAHGFHLTALDHETSARQIAAELVHDFVHVRRHAAQVSPLARCVDIDHALDVVVADDGRGLAACDARQIAENFALRNAAAADGNVPQIA